MLAFERRNADLRAQCGLRVRDRDHAVQIVSFTFEEGVLLHMQNHIQVAGGAALKTTFAISREADAGSVFYSGGNFCVDNPLPQDAGLALALGTGVGNYTPRTLASRAGA